MTITVGLTSIIVILLVVVFVLSRFMYNETDCKTYSALRRIRGTLWGFIIYLVAVTIGFTACLIIIKQGIPL